MARTKIYIAADWTGDSDAVEKLKDWNNSKYWSLSFFDVHETTQSSDSSKNCTIKKSLSQRMNDARMFVLIVGAGTTTRRAGKCGYCNENAECGSSSSKSYVQFECDKAVRDYNNGELDKIVVLYNSTYRAYSRCPENLQDIGTHVAMQYKENDKCYWDYNAVKDALEK